MKSSLILLHGALGCSTELEPLTQRLANQYTIHSFDFEGHGINNSIEDFSMELFSNNLAAFIEDHALASANIFGYSMGGYVALSLACKKPGLINKIFTLGTKFDWNPTTAAHEVRKLNPDKIEEKLPAFANYLANLHGARWKSVVKRTAAMMLNLGNGKGLTDQALKSIQNQVMITVGEHDQMVSQEESKSTATIIPNGQLLTFEGFGHTLREIDFDVLARLITERI